MLTTNATYVRNNWSAVVDSVIRDKPRFIKKTRDHLFLSDFNVLEDLLTAYTFSADEFYEEDGSVTLSLNEIDIIENGTNREDAVNKLAMSIFEYSEEYYKDFSYWARGSRRTHIPYVFKSIVLNDVELIERMITCHPGKI